MARRLIFLAVAALAVLAPPALAADSPGPTSTTVASTTTSTSATTSTTEAVLPTSIVNNPTTPVTVAPNQVTKPVDVQGVVVNRPLPRTGDDFGVQVLFGAGLTAAGLAFAVGARLRRQRVTAHSAS